MEYTLEFDPSEHYRALEAITKLAGQHWWTYVIAFGLPALMSGLPAGIALLAGDPVPWSNVNIWAWVLFPILAFWGLPALMRWQVRRGYRANPTLHGTLRRTVDDVGVAAYGTGATTAFTWDAIQRVEETPEFIFFFYSKKCALYIPKRVIGPDLPKVQRLVATHLRGPAA